jgi:hypothetical protein
MRNRPKVANKVNHIAKKIERRCNCSVKVLIYADSALGEWIAQSRSETDLVVEEFV